MSIRLTNHIAYRFLNDESIIWEIMELHHREIKDLETLSKKLDDEEFRKTATWGAIKYSWELLNPKDSKNYYITESVTDKLDLLKVSRNAEGRYDYTIFEFISSQKCTLILPDNKLIRLYKAPDHSIISFEYLKFTRHSSAKYEGYMNSCMFYVDSETGEQCDHFSHPDVKEIEDYLYKLLCFIFLSETEEVILKPGEKMGTRKSGKIINEVRQPLIVVTSKWNVTSVRTEGFAVSGHFRLQPYGEGRKQVRVKWIDPFEKKGYIRTAKKDLV